MQDDQSTPLSGVVNEGAEAIVAVPEDHLNDDREDCELPGPPPFEEYPGPLPDDADAIPVGPPRKKLAMFLGYVGAGYAVRYTIIRGSSAKLSPTFMSRLDCCTSV